MLGASARVQKEIATEYLESCKNPIRLSPSKFGELLTLVEPKLKNSETFIRSTLSPRIELEVKWANPVFQIPAFISILLNNWFV